MTWPEGVRIDRVGPSVSPSEQLAASPAAKLAEYARFVRAVRAALAAERPQVVYAYEPHALAALAIAGCGAPIVYHRHDLEALGPIDRRSLQGWLYLWARRLGRSADLLVMPERQRAIDYQRFVGDDRAALVVPNFPLRASFPPIDDWGAVLARRSGERQVLLRGALGPDNGILEMVRALAHLDASISLRLCGAAAPSFEREIVALAAGLGVSDRMRCDGYVPYARMNRETVAASVGVVLYRPTNINWQHLGSATNKLYEYAACGVPAVVPDRPSFREFLGGETWVAYADAADPASVAQAIEGLLSDGEAYEARCRAARRAFEERFNYEAVFQPLLAKVLELAARG